MCFSKESKDLRKHKRKDCKILLSPSPDETYLDLPVGGTCRMGAVSPRQGKDKTGRLEEEIFQIFRYLSKANSVWSEINPKEMEEIFHAMLWPQNVLLTMIINMRLLSNTPFQVCR